MEKIEKVVHNLRAGTDKILRIRPVDDKCWCVGKCLSKLRATGLLLKKCFFCFPRATCISILNPAS